MTKWVILTGEYPPQLGGVSDYTRQVAQGLAAAGNEVLVWAPETKEPALEDHGVTVVRFQGGFGPKQLSKISQSLRRMRGPFRLLIQYVPQMYGCMGVNFAFALWVASVRRYRPWVMFHEVAAPVYAAQPWLGRTIAIGTHLMAATVAGSADRCLVSIPSWAKMLRHLGYSQPPLWMPIPSNVATQADPKATAALRLRFASRGLLLGHFGTYGNYITDQLTPALTKLLTCQPHWSVLLVGRGAAAYALSLERSVRDADERIHAAEGLTATDVAGHLAACDLLLQPYGDGASSRRTSLMAGLALGLPIVTTLGFSTEPIWKEEAATVLVPVGRIDQMVAAVENLAADPDARRLLGDKARSTYAKHFSIERTLAQLMKAATLSAVKRC
jgi:glycosyltransferase involved in cell wall biosynthesis